MRTRVRSTRIPYVERVLINGVVTPETLFSDGVLRWSQRAERSLIVEKDVLGFAAEGPKIRIRALVEGGAGICCAASGGAVARKDLVFEPLFEESHRLWCQKLRDYIDSLGRPKRLFVFMNPFGGSKSASKIYLDHVKPLFEDAGIQFKLQETRYQLHEKAVAKTLDLSKYDGVVCVSGDGILVEVVNGLLEKEDWDAAIKVPLGVVPAGTGNGMAKSLLDSVGEPCTPSNAVLAIIRGHKRSLDVATICQGLVADVDIESEKYRWMGSARLDFYAVQRIVHLRQYNGSISFVPAPGFETYGEPTSYSNNGEPANQHNACAPNQEEPINFRQHGYEGPEEPLGGPSFQSGFTMCLGVVKTQRQRLMPSSRMVILYRRDNDEGLSKTIIALVDGWVEHRKPYQITICLVLQGESIYFATWVLAPRTQLREG